MGITVGADICGFSQLDQTDRGKSPARTPKAGLYDLARSGEAFPTGAMRYRACAARPAWFH